MLNSLRPVPSTLRCNFVFGVSHEALGARCFVTESEQATPYVPSKKAQQTSLLGFFTGSLFNVE
jgi:hypothetical protein